MIKNIYSLLCLICIGQLLYGQRTDFRHYETDQELSNNTVYTIIQDTEGFIWAGTKDGVNRFDGIHFTSIPVENIHRTQNSINTSIKLLQDAKKQIWLGTEKGLFLFNKKQGRFELLSLHLTETVNSIIEDKKNSQLYISHDNKLYRINEKTWQISFIKTQEAVFALSEIRQEFLWFADFTGNIHSYQISTGKVRSYNVFGHSKNVVSHGIEKTYFFDDSTLLVGTTNQGVKLFNAYTKQYIDLLSNDLDGGDLYVRDFLKINDHQFWMATEKGLINFDISTQTFFWVTKETDNPYSLSDNATYCLYRDFEGGIWVGTYFGGINYSPKYYNNFTNIFPLHSQNSLKGSIVREIVQDKNRNFWVGTEDNGLNKFTTDTRTFTHFSPGGHHTISSSNVHGLLALGDELWVGTFDHGLDVIDINTHKIIRHYNYGSGKNDLKSNFIHSLAAHKGKVIIGTSNGLYIYNRKLDNFELVESVPSGSFYSALYSDNYNTIWAGTFLNGLYKMLPDKNKTVRIRLDNAQKEDILLTKKITDIFQDTHENLWIATESGLFLYNPNTNKYREFSQNKGLPSNLIYSIKEDNSGFLWISTSKGLASLNLTDTTIKTFNANNDLLFTQFNYKSSFKDEDGYLYFGGIKGLIKFRPESFIKDSFEAPLYITALRTLRGREITMNGATSVALNYKEGSFSINFAALEYAFPKAIKYKYRLKNIEENWNEINSNRTIYYTNLSPGKYEFQVLSTNAAGAWMNNEKKIKIIIQPPIWQSFTAYILYIIAFLLLAYYIYRLIRARRLEKQKRKWPKKKRISMSQKSISLRKLRMRSGRH